MTPLHRDLTRLGYTDLRTPVPGGATAGLHHVPNGTAVRFGLQVDADGATWESQNTLPLTQQGLTDALACLNSWEISERAKASLNGQAARP